MTRTHAMIHRDRALAWAGLLAVSLCSGGLCVARAQYHEPFEAPEKSWQPADHDGSLRLIQHVRTFDAAHEGQASEFLRFQAGGGTYFHLTHVVPESRVIEELSISLWVKSTRAGAQLAARVVLPRSKHPRTGVPISLLVRGSSYAQVGTWQRLTIQQPQLLVARQIPLLRSQLECEISEREAYVDLVVLNAYAGAGVTDLWLDDLELNGQVSTGTSIRLVGAQGEDADPRGPSAPAVDGAGSMSRPGPGSAEQGRPQLVRAVDYQGEPFAWLKGLGFNVLCLPAAPTDQQLREAAKHGLWLIAPPPLGKSPLVYGAGLSRVAAWNVGESLGQELVESTRRLATELQSVPLEARRPVCCLPRDDLSQYSRIVDVVLCEPPGPPSSLPVQDYGRWYLQRARLMRSGTPFWAVIRTQVHASVMEQVQALTDAPATPWSLEPEQIRLLAYHALAAGAQGLVFRSHSRLDSPDRQSVLRANTLRQLNLELLLLEPWAATGQHEAELDAGDATVRASVLKTDRSRLLLVLRHAGDEQYVAGRSIERPVTLDVPGVPETDEAYWLTAAGLQRIRRERSAGLRITLERPQAVALVVLTQDPLVINFLARQLTATRTLHDDLSREIATQQYAEVVATHQQLLAATPASRLTAHTLDDRSLSLARSELQHFEQLMSSGGHERAYDFLQRGLQQLSAARYHHWRLAVDSFPSPISSPLCVCFAALPQHQALSQRLQTATWGANAVAGGNFENLQHLQAAGWRNLVRPHPDLTTGVELSLHNPHSGRSALRLQCWPARPDQTPLAVEAAPVSIVSGPIPVRAGQIVRIHGWARVPQPIQASLDGLLVFDSLAGPELAARILVTRDWQEFTLYRAATRDGPLTVTFALTGFGQSWLDDLTVHLLEPASHQARR
ncbi:MAG: hypothetical protein MUF48_09095 [Pirellulaceae bacterium]|nr:hypothetical protein [Pirellulaceae bacterium]